MGDLLFVAHGKQQVRTFVDAAKNYRNGAMARLVGVYHSPK